MKYNFDIPIQRKGTGSIKYDKLAHFFGKTDLQPLWVADMDFATPDFILDAIGQRLQHPILGYTMRKQGFNQSFMRWYKQRHGWQVQEDWLDFSPGVVGALALAILALTDAGDKIIIQPPVYHPFFEVVKGNNRVLVENPLKKNENGSYEMDFEHLESIIDHHTKMMIIANPHNPVGRVWTKEELQTLGDIAVKHNLIILSDDIHMDFIYPPHQYTPLASLSDAIAKQTITITSPSKTFNIAGLSTSIVVIPNAEMMQKYQKKLFDMHLFLGNIFGTVAFESAYNQGAEWLDQLLVYLQSNIDFVCDYLQQNIPDIKPVKPEGTFLMWLNFSATGLLHQEIKRKLIEEAGLALNDGLSFGDNGQYYFRMNIATTRANIEEALKKLQGVFG